MSGNVVLVLTLLMFLPCSHVESLLSNHRHMPSAVQKLRMMSCQTQSLSLNRLDPPFDEDIYCFYRKNYSHKRFVPSLPKNKDKNNNILYALQSQDQSLVAAVWLSRNNADKEKIFVRYLCVKKSLRRQGLALNLMERAFDEYGNYTYYCLASQELAPLYKRAGFLCGKENAPKWMVEKYRSIALVWNRKNPHTKLLLFVKKPPLKVVILQHANEASRPTTTATLLLDNEHDSETNKTKCSPPLQNYLSVQYWTWSGRIDNKRIENQLDQLESPTLLWTDGNHNASDCSLGEKNNSTTYVVLDGTWQEARSMSRKMPFLYKLPRLSLNTKHSSTFRLRSDYTGWRERFGGGEQLHLLCTAEVVAALLERAGNCVGEKIVRMRLEKFQQDYTRAGKTPNQQQTKTSKERGLSSGK